VGIQINLKYNMSDEENANQLSFGEEFNFSGTNNVQCLTNDEVFFFLADKRNYPGTKSE
jgi:hypothetical protein